MCYLYPKICHSCHVITKTKLLHIVYQNTFFSNSAITKTKLLHTIYQNDFFSNSVNKTPLPTQTLIVVYTPLSALFISTLFASLVQFKAPWISSAQALLNPHMKSCLHFTIPVTSQSFCAFIVRLYFRMLVLMKRPKSHFQTESTKLSDWSTTLNFGISRPTFVHIGGGAKRCSQKSGSHNSGLVQIHSFTQLEEGIYIGLK